MRSSLATSEHIFTSAMTLLYWAWITSLAPIRQTRVFRPGSRDPEADWGRWDPTGCLPEHILLCNVVLHLFGSRSGA